MSSVVLHYLKKPKMEVGKLVKRKISKVETRTGKRLAETSQLA